LPDDLDDALTVLEVLAAAYSRCPQLARKPLCFRNLDDGARPTDRRPRRFPCLHNIGETDTIILGPDCIEPMPHIARSTNE
jgi:hypothetical protein